MGAVLVIGGRGYYGAAVVRVLERLPEVTVRVASRRAGVALDLGDPATFAAMDEHDVVINCADSVGAPPDEAARHVLARGGTFIDMGADAPAVERLLSLATGTNEPPRGRVIVGAGVFPGLSTALARRVHELAGDDTVELGVRLSPLSGAGKANCDLMMAMLELPSIRFEDGARVTGPPLGPAVPLPFAGRRRAASLVGLPDAALIHRVTGARNVRTYLAVVPGFLRLNFGLLVGMFTLLSRAPPLRAALRWMVSGSLWLMRAVLLRGVSSRLELTAIAGRGTPRELARTLEFDDGQEAVALGAAAVVARALERGDSLPTGVYAVPERFSLAELLAVIEGITGRQVRGDGLL